MSLGDSLFIATAVAPGCKHGVHECMGCMQLMMHRVHTIVGAWGALGFMSMGCMGHIGCVIPLFSLGAIVVTLHTRARTHTQITTEKSDKGCKDRHRASIFTPCAPYTRARHAPSTPEQPLVKPARTHRGSPCPGLCLQMRRSRPPSVTMHAVHGISGGV